ncbi:MAG TPA: PHB depolymerase family esterase [Nevskiaceae bacterium]|nr:PHB depolymerase family esterase [Nevskiaceae bacterium]
MMRRHLRIWLTGAAALAAVACKHGGEAVDTGLGIGSFEKFHYAQDGVPARDYYVYLPTDLPGGPALLVYLHGCQQDATDAALGTRWNQEAQARKFIVVYPQQLRPSAEDAQGQLDGNGAGCWNWFEPQNWNRGAGEAATIAGITREVMAAHAVDPQRVYLEGVSAGGMMASIMGATYADLYAAIGIDAGGGYPAGTDPTGALAAMAMNGYATRMPVIVFAGTADEVDVYPLNVEAVQQWLATNDMLDDGTENGSVSPLPATLDNRGLDAAQLAHLGPPGNLCVSPQHLASPCFGPAIGLQGSYPYTVEHYLDADGNPLIDFWTIYGLTHNYVGGNPQGSFTDPLGPDITGAAWDFFLAHPRSP